jgi:hypothetical protein
MTFKAITKSAPSDVVYPKNRIIKNLEWIAKLIKGNLNSKCIILRWGFDTHDNQLAIHKNKLTELNDAVFNFYEDLKAQLLQNPL